MVQTHFRRLSSLVPLLLLMVISGSSAVYFYVNEITLAYIDGLSRMMSARQVFYSNTPGLGHIGWWWPPLPQIGMLPFVGIDLLYYSGIAGIVLPAITFILGGFYIYRLVLEITSDWVAGLIGVVAYSSPSLLVMQSVPMSEAPFIAFFVIAFYSLVRLAKYPYQWQNLVLMGLSLLAAESTRYEGYLLGALCSCMVLVIGLKHRLKYETIFGYLVFLNFLQVCWLAFFLLLNLITFGDVLYFARGEFSAVGWGERITSSLPPDQRTAGNIYFSILVYWKTIVDTVGLPTLLLALLGGFYVLVSRLSILVKVCVLMLAFPLVLYPLGMYQGGWIQIVHPELMSGNIINLRFGTFIIPAAAVLVGFLVQKKLLLQMIVFPLVLYSSYLVIESGIPTIREALANQSHEDNQIQIVAGTWFRDNYDGGKVLRQRVGNELVAFYSQIPFNQVVYEGDRSLWRDSLVKPSENVSWVFMRKNENVRDVVWERLRGQPDLEENFTLVYEFRGIEVYRRGHYQTIYSKKE